MRKAVSSLALTVHVVRKASAYPRIAAYFTPKDFAFSAWRKILRNFQKKFNMNSANDKVKTNKEATEMSAVVKDVATNANNEKIILRRVKTVDYESMDKEALISRIHNLESELRSIRTKLTRPGEYVVPTVEKRRRKKEARHFDFTRWNTRHVALQIAYLGWDYTGLEVNASTTKTIEYALFDSLMKTRLIESRQSSNYHRCGRTDKGVSARGQVISIDLRTNLLEGVGVKVREGGTAHERAGDQSEELSYLAMLNNTLPPEIRVLGWCPVHPDFSARFNCNKRTYKYFFPMAGLDLEAMQKAANNLYGVHDFRNLCKMDIKNGVTTYIRNITHATITKIGEENQSDGYTMCIATISGKAFLWHQIRCIMHVLFLVGLGQEDPSIVTELLNIEKNPSKPGYALAADFPLVLYEAEFDDIEWICDQTSQQYIVERLQRYWAEYAIKTSIIKSFLDYFPTQSVKKADDGKIVPITNQANEIIGDNGNKRSLMKRSRCETLEERVDKLVKKRKVETCPDKSDKDTDSQIMKCE